MKTSMMTAGAEAEETSITSVIPPKKRTEVENTEPFTDEDDDFDIPLDDGLDTLEDLDLDDDDF